MEKMKTHLRPYRSAIVGRKIAEKAQPRNITEPIKPMRKWGSHARSSYTNQLSSEVSSVQSIQ